MTALAAWCLAAAVAYAPPEARPQYPGHEETREQTVERYEALCDAMVDVATATPERPGFLSHPDRVALLIALGVVESGFARDADVGPCHRGPKERARCDSGRSASVWQVQARAHGVTVGELHADRRLAAGIALRVALGSIARCRAVPLAAYVAGRCDVGPEATAAARSRWETWQRLRWWQPDPKTGGAR